MTVESVLILSDHVQVRMCSQDQWEQPLNVTKGQLEHDAKKKTQFGNCHSYYSTSIRW